MIQCVLYIPTNRECKQAIRAYAAEAQRLAEICGSAIFVVIESNEKPHTLEHIKLIAEIKNKFEIPLLHFTLPLQRRFVNEILQKTTLTILEQKWVYTQLLPKETSYGAGPNKAALLACALGASWLHRRDSDTKPQLYKGQPLYPVELESRILGLSLTQCVDFLPAQHLTTGDRILGIGTDYQGLAAHDRMEFQKISPELLIEHERLENPGESLVGLQERVERKFINRDQKPYAEDIIEVDRYGQSEMGAFAVAELFRYLPEMPITDTLGSDYFLKSLIYRLNLPALYHNRRVEHSHKGVIDLETDVNSFLSYSIKDSRFKILKRILKRHNYRLTETIVNRLGVKLNDRCDPEIYASSLEYALKNTPLEELYQMLAELARLYHRAGNLSEQKGDKFYLVSQYITEHLDDLIHSVILGFEDYARLVRIWPMLTIAAQDLPVLKWALVA